MNDKMISFLMDCFLKESPFEDMSEETEKKATMASNNALILGFMIGYQIGKTGIFEEEREVK